MDGGAAEGVLPVLRCVLADLPELLGARGHALLELGREAVQRVLRDAKRAQPLVGEADRDPRIPIGVGRRPGGVEEREQPSNELAPGVRVLDLQQQVPADIG
jgi:hypothetical protein